MFFKKKNCTFLRVLNRLHLNGKILKLKSECRGNNFYEYREAVSNPNKENVEGNRFFLSRIVTTFHRRIKECNHGLFQDHYAALNLALWHSGKIPCWWLNTGMQHLCNKS